MLAATLCCALAAVFGLDPFDLDPMEQLQNVGDRAVNGTESGGDLLLLSDRSFLKAVQLLVHGAEPVAQDVHVSLKKVDDLNKVVDAVEKDLNVLCPHGGG